ncbi:hypothetical protein GQ457_04G004440 [Hibiscus cannabinus]
MESKLLLLKFRPLFLRSLSLAFSLSACRFGAPLTSSSAIFLRFRLVLRYGYKILIFACCKEGMISEAVKQGIEPNVDTYSVSTNGHCLQNGMNNARAVFQLMIKKGCTPNIRSYNVIINGYCKAKRLDEAMELFHEIS